MSKLNNSPFKGENQSTPSMQQPQTTSQQPLTSSQNQMQSSQQEQPQPQQSQQPQQQGRRKSNSVSKPPKTYDTLLDNWYYTEVNKRANEDPQLFKNYQINPYTKKTLEFVTPKITERRRPLPREPCCCDPNIDPSTLVALSDADQKIVESFKLVNRGIRRSVSTPQEKYCEPQTEGMRLGWYPPRYPPPTNLSCMYILPYQSPTPCCYFHPKPDYELTQNEQYDERFRAVHRTASFIHTISKLRHFDSIMNPEGFRGKIKTDKKRPSSFSRQPPNQQQSMMATSQPQPQQQQSRMSNSNAPPPPPQQSMPNTTASRQTTQN